MNSENTRRILERALRKGGQVLLEYGGKTIETTVKESISSVVTEADLNSERGIIEVLESAPEPYNIISEESGFTNHHAEYTWVVDPLDGTSNFAAGLPWFGVIITLFRGTIPVQAGIYLPVEDQLYYAESGKGTWKNDQPVHTSGSDDLSEILIAYSFDFSDYPGKTGREMDLMARLSQKIRNIRSTNCLIDFCYAVDGRLGAAINQTTRIWDIAAPWLMIREAGGVVTDIKGSEIEFDLSPGAMDQNYTIVAAGSGVHGQLMRIINL
jgi:myo-inositol-1(or 4)-monophosphatase